MRRRPRFVLRSLCNLRGGLVGAWHDCVTPACACVTTCAHHVATPCWSSPCLFHLPLRAPHAGQARACAPVSPTHCPMLLLTPVSQISRRHGETSSRAGGRSRRAAGQAAAPRRMMATFTSARCGRRSSSCRSPAWPRALRQLGRRGVGERALWTAASSACPMGKGRMWTVTRPECQTMGRLFWKWSMMMTCATSTRWANRGLHGG